jgi:hypothetical protein
VIKLQRHVSTCIDNLQVIINARKFFVSQCFFNLSFHYRSVMQFGVFLCCILGIHVPDYFHFEFLLVI